MNSEARNQGASVGERINTAALSVVEQGGALRQTGTQYSTAIQVQIPRNLVEIEKRCLIEAELAGESLYYGWGAGNSQIEGPTIECAMILLRNYGNAALAQRPVIETDKAFIFAAAFVDLETGVTYERQYRQSKKSRVSFKTDEARQDEIRFAIGQSKCDRNVILRVLPSWLTDKMIARAKEGVLKKVKAWIDEKGIAFARNTLEKTLAKLGIDEPRIVAKYEKSKNQWDAHTLTLLSGDVKVIQSGYDTPEAIFPIPTVERTDNVDLSGASPKFMSESDHQDHDGRTEADKVAETKTEPPKESKASKTTPLGERAKNIPNRKALLGDIKVLENTLGLSELELKALKNEFNIKNLSRTVLKVAMNYKKELEKMRAAAGNSKEAEGLDSPVKPDRDALIEEIIGLEETTKLDGEAVSKLGDDLKIPDDLGDCSTEQLAAYRTALKMDPEETTDGEAPKLKFDGGSTKEERAAVLELEEEFAIKISAIEIAPLREKTTGHPELDLMTSEQLGTYSKALSDRITAANAAKAAKDESRK